MVKYRTYQPGDEGSIVALWNQCLPQDAISIERFRRLIILDNNFDPEGLQVAVVEDRIIGCAYAVRRLLPMHETELEPDLGWITFFFVATRYQRNGIGSGLLTEAASFLAQRGRKLVFFSSYAPNYILPGLDEQAYPEAYQLLLKHGFERQYSPVAMDLSLNGFVIPEDVRSLKKERESEGYHFGIAQDKDLYEVIQFATSEFNPDWGRAIREGILQGLPLKRILIARHENKLVGFCMYGGYDGVLERFGPFGVDSKQQGKGLGKLLLYECLYLMRSEELHGAWFLWTGEASSAGYLYKKTGFEISRKFHVMKKTL